MTASPTRWRATRSPKAVDAALKLATKAKRRRPTNDDAPRPSTFPGKPRHIEGQLDLFVETSEADAA